MPTAAEVLTAKLDIRELESRIRRMDKAEIQRQGKILQSGPDDQTRLKAASAIIREADKAGVIDLIARNVAAFRAVDFRDPEFMKMEEDAARRFNLVGVSKELQRVEGIKSASISKIEAVVNRSGQARIELHDALMKHNVITNSLSAAGQTLTAANVALLIAAFIGTALGAMSIGAGLLGAAQ